MTAQKPRANRAQPARPVAFAITAFICGLAAHDQLATDSLDYGYQVMLVLLVLFWAGQGIDEFLPRWGGK